MTLVITPLLPIFSKEYLSQQCKTLRALNSDSLASKMDIIVSACIPTLQIESSPGSNLNILVYSPDDPYSILIAHSIHRQFDAFNLKVYSYNFIDSALARLISEAAQYEIISLSSIKNTPDFHFCSSFLPVGQSFFAKLQGALGAAFPRFCDNFGNVHLSLLPLILFLLRQSFDDVIGLVGNHPGLPSLAPPVRTLPHDNSDVIPKAGKKLFIFSHNSSSSLVASEIQFDSGLGGCSLPLQAIKKGPQEAVVLDVLGRQLFSDCYEKIKFEIKPRDFEPYMFTAYFNRGGGGNDVIKALVDSLGCRFAYAEDYLGYEPGIPICWGVLRNSKAVLDDAQLNQQHFLYIDHAYFCRGHRASYRITANAFESNLIKNCPMDRLDLFNISLQPWNKAGDKIIVCPPTEYFAEAHKVYGWLDETLAQLCRFTDRKIIVRKKPTNGKTVVPLAEQLKTAYALVTHSSNVAVESICLGTPVFVSSGSAASAVGCTDLSKIESPLYPDREPWVANLSYCQFTYEEIRGGSFLPIFRDYHSFDDLALS